VSAAGRRRLPRTRAAIAAAVLGALLLPAGAAGAQVQTPLPSSPRRAFLFLVDRVSFEEVMAVPQFLALARAGGAGLLSHRRHPDDGGLGPYLTIGAGAKAAVPSSRIAAIPGQAAFPEEAMNGILEVNDAAVPGLLAQLMVGAGHTVRVYGNADDRFGPNAPGVLVGMDFAGSAEGRVQGLTRPRPELLGGLRTDGPQLGRMVTPSRGDRAPADLTVVDLGDTHRIDQEAGYARRGAAAPQRAQALAKAGALVEGLVRAAGGSVMVIVVTPSGSEDMDRAGDVVTSMIVAEGRADSLFPAEGAPRGLTSGSTRYPGLVLAEDVAPTILQFFEVTQPLDMTGAPVRAEGDAPFASHLRHLEHRRIRLPVQIGFGVAAILLLLLAGAVLLVRRPVSRRILAVTGAAASASIGLPLALLAMGILPHLVYAQVIPTGLVVSSVAGLIAWRRRDRDPGFPVVVLAAVTGLAVVVDGLFGWHASATSMAGGTVWEGRGYGIRNLWLGPVLAGTILVCARLRPRVGLGVGLAVAAFVGIPGLGSDVGGYLTLSASAWLLYFLLARGRIGLREILIAGGATVAGLVLLLLGDGYLNPTPTHVGRFAERVASDGLGTFVGVVLERLRLSVRTIGHIPAAWLLVAWFGVAAWLAPRVGGTVGAAFDRSPGFRESMWVLAVASLIAIAVNDSGISTTNTTIAYSIGGFILPALALRERRLTTRDRAAPPAARGARVRAGVG
jgi:hypothetical protein